MKSETNSILWGGDPSAQNLKFAREWRGYRPQEVDLVLDALFNKNKDLSDENARLRETLAQCEPKIQQLTQNTAALEQERLKENLRLAEVMTSAGKAAEGVVAEARRKAAELAAAAETAAEETLADARRRTVKMVADAELAAKTIQKNAEVDARVAYKEMSRLIEVIQTAQDSSNRHYEQLNAVLRGAVGALAALQPSAPPPPTAL